MKRTFVYLLMMVCAFLFGPGCASTGSIRDLGKKDAAVQAKAEEEMKKPPLFYTKKRFTFLMAWNGIPVGSIVAEVRDVIDYRDYKVYEVQLKTESNAFLSKIYRVEDIYTSYVDVNTMTSRRYEADRKEGNYRKHQVVEYDFASLKAKYTNLTDGSVKYCSIKKDVQDPLSSMCYFMTLPLNVGDEVGITVNLNEKNYDVYGKIEDLLSIKLADLGSFAAFKIRPYAMLGKERFKKGKAYMFFSADKRYPLLGVAETPFGKVTATLRSVEEI